MRACMAKVNACIWCRTRDGNGDRSLIPHGGIHLLGERHQPSIHESQSSFALWCCFLFHSPFHCLCLCSLKGPSSSAINVFDFKAPQPPCLYPFAYASHLPHQPVLTFLLLPLLQTHHRESDIFLYKIWLGQVCTALPDPRLHFLPLPHAPHHR